MLLLAFVCVAVLLMIYTTWIEPRRAVLTREVVVLPHLAHSVRVLFLSDLHIGLVTPAHQILQMLHQLNSAEFDVVLLGGDFIDRDARYVSQLEEVLTYIVGFGKPVYAVLGNHEHLTFGEVIEPLQNVMKKTGIVVLCNEGVKISLQNQEVLLVGMRDIEDAPSYGRHTEYVPLKKFFDCCQKIDWYQQFDEVYPELPRIMLTHNPDGVYLPGKRRPDLVLAGHTHGGVIFLLDWISAPAWRILWSVLPKGSFCTWAGRTLVGHTPLIVGRGLGGSSLPFRLGRPPEIIIVTLSPV
jgi:predicted MPP superfamily phosphohydrolase